MDVCAGEYTAAGFAPANAECGVSVLAAPFTIAGGTSFMTTGISDGSAVISASLGISESVVLITSMPPASAGQWEISLSLSAMDGSFTAIETVNCLAAEGRFTLPVQSGQNLSGVCTIRNTLGDSGYSGEAEIYAPLLLTGFTGSLALSTPSLTGLVSADNVQLFTDGIDCTEYLSEMNISLFGIPEATVSLSVLIKSAKTFSSVINGVTYQFDVTSVSASDGKTVLGGTMQEPEGSFSADVICRASEAAAELSGKIIWAARDFVASVKGTFTHMSLAQYLADSAGLSVRLLPDGYIVVSGSGTDVSLAPSGVFSRTFNRNEHKYSVITVNYGSYESNYVHISAPSQAETGEAAQIRLYHTGNAILTSDSEYLTLLVRNVTETVTEDILFKNGKGALSVPAKTILTPEVTADGKNAVCGNLNGFKAVSYTAVYDLYSITEAADTKRYITASAGSAVVLLFSEGSQSLTFSAPALCDRVSALRLAHSLADTTDRIALETTHMDGLCTPAGLLFKSRFGSGRLVSAVIKASGSPLAVKNIIEVQP